MTTQTTVHSAEQAAADDFLRVTLWAAQAVVALAFCFFGLFKLTGPWHELVQEFKWPADYPPLFTRALGLIDILGGVGILLPALTRILPRLTVLAAAGATLLQLLAIAFHASRGEFAVLPLNYVLLPMAAYVWWGRARAAPVSALKGAAARQRFIHISLWAAQCFVAFVFCAAGITKWTAPAPELNRMMPWAADHSALFIRFVATVDLAGGIGILLPALTRLWPRCTVAAAVGCVALQCAAIALHVQRAEWPVLPLNGVLLVLAAYVAWGRTRWAVIAPLRGSAARRRFVNVTLWAAQAVVAAGFIAAGMFKLSAPIADLAAAMKWPGEFPPSMVRLLGAIDLAGGLGIWLPALTRIQPRLTVLAALGCSVLQVLAIAFHTTRGEYSVLTLNFVLLPCALWVLWGRWRLAPITPRLSTA